MVCSNNIAVAIGATKPTRIYREWCKRIDSRTITYGTCRQFCRGIAGDSGHRTALTDAEKDDLVRRAEAVWDDGGFDLVGTYGWPPEDWKVAANGWMARNGRLAFSAHTGLCGAPDLIELAACEGTLDFRWVGEIDGYPIFRAIPPINNPWDYYAVPWQAKAYG